MLLKLFVRNLSSLPKCNFTPKSYDGPSLDTMKRIRKTNLNPSLGSTYYSKPLAIHQGFQQWIFDINGKRYLDMYAGICTVSVGHSHPKITEAVNQQLQTLTHCSNVYFHPKIHEYAEKLAEKLPEKLKVIYFVNSGSEANDLAILLARSYTRKTNIYSLKNSYHGMTYQTMALTNHGQYKYPVLQNPGFLSTINPDVYKGIWGGNKCRDSPVQTERTCNCKNECEAGNSYFKQFEEDLDFNGAQDVAAFFAESIQGYGGAVQFPKNYLKKVYDKIHELGGIFVADEVQTGFGRTGEHFWGFEMHNVQPDIVTMAKGIGNGFPLAAVATTQEIGASLTKATHFNTFGGNPIASVVGLSVLEIIQEEKLQENAHQVGTYLLKKLEHLRDENSHVGDVRGKGLMIGIELVEDKHSKKPLEPKKFMKLWENCLENGLLIGRGGLFGNVLRIKPPMCVTKEDADFTVNILRIALENI